VHEASHEAVYGVCRMDFRRTNRNITHTLSSEFIMNISDFVFNSIYRGALKGGASEHSAHSHAVMGLDDFKKGKFPNVKASKLINDRIAQAKKVKK